MKLEEMINVHVLFRENDLFIGNKIFPHEYLLPLNVIPLVCIKEFETLKFVSFHLDEMAEDSVTIRFHLNESTYVTNFYNENVSNRTVNKIIKMMKQFGVDELEVSATFVEPEWKLIHNYIEDDIKKWSDISKVIESKIKE